MSTTVKTGWLKDNNGEKFAPKTLASQVQTSDGILLEDKIQADLDTIKTEIQADIENIDLSAYETKEDAQLKLDELDSHTSNPDIHFTATERTKLSGIAAGAQVNTITGVKGSSESSYRTGNINITKANIGLGNADNTSDANKPVSTAQQTAIDTALASAKSYTDTKITGLASTSSVNTSISNHNTSTSAHNDIRGLITNLTTKLNNFLDVDDTTTDQLSEVITLINNNKGTLESLTTSKINVSDIVNNLTTNSTSKVLSAAQGVAIKSLIDALQAELDGKTGTSHTHTVSHTPAGTVSKPTFTGSAATSGAPSGTTSVYSITGVGSVPSLSASVTNKCLTLTFSAGSVPTRSSVEVASLDHTHSVTAKGSVSQPTFTGTAASLTTGGAN